MIKIIDGDLFETDAKFIVHQVNCMGRMGSGVALQVKEKYPHVYEEYKKLLLRKCWVKFKLFHAIPNILDAILAAL